MKIVLFSRVPRWYSFRNERLVSRLAAEGHEIAGIIVEQTSTFKSIREWLWKLGFRVFIKKALQKIAGKKAPNRAAKNILPSRKVSPKVFFVKSHNSIECAAILKNLEPEIIVLRGCGIIKKQILEIPRIGVINPHYALLPAYRGMDVTEWSALHGAPVAVSVHTVNEGVDTGIVLKSEEILISSEDTTGTLRDKCAALAVELIAEALSEIAVKRVLPEEFGKAGGRQYFQMHPRLKKLADARIKKFGATEKSINEDQKSKTKNRQAATFAEN
ncbi:MAG TPA: formyl transferase [Pyrinomonadaceae bacterium]|jgi:methionyl-tRNA formyltransferase